MPNEAASRPAAVAVSLCSPDGAGSEARFYAGEGGSRAGVVIVPAMGVPARYYDAFAKELASLGLAALVAELRGIGSSSLRAGRGVDFGYRELAAVDLPLAVAALRERCPGAPLVLAGHSLGGQVSLLFASLFPGEVDGVALVASGSPHYLGFPPGTRLVALGGIRLLKVVSEGLGYLPGRALGFGGREARRLIAEWSAWARSGRLEPAGLPPGFDVGGAFAKLELPVLSVTFGGDKWAPRGAVERLLAMAPRAKTTRVSFQRGSIAPDVDHFRWAKHPAKPARALADWVDALPRRAAGALRGAFTSSYKGPHQALGARAPGRGAC